MSTTKTNNETDFKIAVNELRQASPNVANDFVIEDPKTFYKAFISTENKCDIIVNSMSETFNAYIVQVRARHLIYVFEDIRLALM